MKLSLMALGAAYATIGFGIANALWGPQATGEFIAALIVYVILYLLALLMEEYVE